VHLPACRELVLDRGDSVLHTNRRQSPNQLRTFPHELPLQYLSLCTRSVCCWDVFVVPPRAASTIFISMYSIGMLLGRVRRLAASAIRQTPERSIDRSACQCHGRGRSVGLADMGSHHVRLRRHGGGGPRAQSSGSPRPSTTCAAASAPTSCWRAYRTCRTRRRSYRLLLTVVQQDQVLPPMTTTTGA
jgi:hypothetical protein